MRPNIANIPGCENWKTVSEVRKGWSDDRKFLIEAPGERLLLRLTDIAGLERKEEEFKAMKKLDVCDILMSRPIAAGRCEMDGVPFSYLLLTWIEGEEMEKALPRLSLSEQYRLGRQAGEALRKMHGVPAPDGQPEWSEWEGRKIDRNIKRYRDCPIRMPKDKRMLEYIEKTRPLMKGRPQTFQHGDYHCGNLVLTPGGPARVGIIDFNRFDYGDPWEEFNRIVWCAQCSPAFASGRIDGYFAGETVPELFFRLTALYICSNTLSSIPWSISFGQKEVDTMTRQYREILEWYQDFETFIPIWY